MGLCLNISRARRSFEVKFNSLESSQAKYLQTNIQGSFYVQHFCWAFGFKTTVSGLRKPTLERVFAKLYSSRLAHMTVTINTRVKPAKPESLYQIHFIYIPYVRLYSVNRMSHSLDKGVFIFRLKTSSCAAVRSGLPRTAPCTSNMTLNYARAYRAIHGSAVEFLTCGCIYSTVCGIVWIQGNSIFRLKTSSSAAVRSGLL